MGPGRAGRWAAFTFWNRLDVSAPGVPFVAGTGDPPMPVLLPAVVTRPARRA